MIDQFDVVRAFYHAVNHHEMDAAADLYHPTCVTENVYPDDEGVVYRGAQENRQRLHAFAAAFAGGFDDGSYFRVRTIGGIGTGWGWVQADWVERIREVENGVRQFRGYSHFLVEDGFIRRHRTVAQEEKPSETEPVEAARSERQYPTRPIVGVGAVILITKRDQERIQLDVAATVQEGVVLIKRRFEPLAGQWSLPGGTLDVGETLEAGVAREIAEETGLAVEVGPVVEVFDRILFDGDRRVRYHFVLIDYLCRPRGGRLRAGSDVSVVTIADPAALGEYGVTAKAEVVIQRALTMAAPP